MNKTTIRRLLSLILASTVALSMFGCAANPSQAGTAGTQAKDSAQEPAAEAQAEDAVQEPAAEAQAEDAAQEPAADTQAEDAAQEPAAETQAQDTAKAPAAAEPDDPEIRELISSMTTKEKLSQMMIVSLRSDIRNTESVTKIDEDYAEQLQKHDFGGVILFVGNIVDPAQTVTLIRGCQEAAMSSAHGIPMFICVDQ